MVKGLMVIAQYLGIRNVEKNNLPVPNPIFKPPLNITIEKNPQRSPAMPADFIN